MTIQTINFVQLRNSEHIQFNKAVKHVFDEHDPVALHVKDQYDAFVEKNDTMETVFVTAQGNVLTKSLVERR